jgi:hypothetical protein
MPSRRRNLSPSRGLFLAAALALASALPAAAQIEVGELTSLDGWAAGEVRGQPLPRTLWAGSDAAGLAALFDRLPRSFESPAADALVRRTLSAPASRPGGDAAPAALRKRFEALGKLGAAQTLARMTQGEAARDPGIAQFAAQAELALRDTRAACRRTQSAAAAAPFLLRLSAYCAASAKDSLGMDLALEGLKAAGTVDPWFVQTSTYLAGPDGAPAPAKLLGKYDASLHAAMSIEAKLKPGPKALNGSSQLAILRVAGDENAPAGLRYGAAVIALRHGLIDETTARGAIRGQAAAKGKLQPLAEALRSVEAAAAPGDRARAIATALARADAFGAAVTTARLLASDIRSLPKSPETADSAARLARAAVLLGDMDAARAWRAAMPVASGDPAVAAVLDLALAAAQGGDAGMALARRIDFAGSAPGRAARDVAAVSALGGPLPSAAATFLLSAPPSGVAADAGVMSALALASQRGAVGETALLAGTALANGAHTLDRSALAAIVAALRTVGLEADARAIAAEAIAADLRP